MIRKDQKTVGNETRTYVRVVESYRPLPGSNPKQRTIKSFGYLEEQKDLESFWAEVNACNDGLKHERGHMVELPADQTLFSKDGQPLNYGYKFPESVYQLLGIDKFLDDYQKQSKFRGKYSLNEAFRYLVMDRILHPASKRDAVSRFTNYYGMESELRLSSVYRALDEYDHVFYDLQRFISGRVKELFGRQLDFSFYDVTNYYTEKDFANPDEPYLDRYGELVVGKALAQRGVSKEHRLSPIIQMGLFMDSQGVPVCMDVYRGNMGDAETLKENLDGFKKEYDIERTVVVADKGMNCAHNIDLLCSRGDGYVFSQALKGTRGKRYHEALFSPEGWQSNKDGSYRWKLITEEYPGFEITFEEKKDENGKTQRLEHKKPVTRKRQVLLYWSEADAKLAEKKRLEKLERAWKSTRNNAYGIAKGKDRYIKEETILRATGEVLDRKTARTRVLVDELQAEEDARFDGYFAIATSEMDYDAKKIHDVYHGLWRIEESFRIMKSDFDARPIFLNTRSHIRAHFLICFVALIIIRLIQNAMGRKRISVERIAEALRSANCLKLGSGCVRLLNVGGKIKYKEVYNARTRKVSPTLKLSDEDQVTLDYRLIQRVFNAELCYAYVKQEDLKRFFGGMRLRNAKPVKQAKQNRQREATGS